MLIATLTGNVGKTPELKSTRNGKTYAVFSVACNEYVNKEKQTIWVNVTVFDEYKAKFIGQYVQKGAKVTLIGDVKARVWTNQAGEAVPSLDVTLGFNSFFELQSKMEEGAPHEQPNTTGNPAPPQGAPAGHGLDDDIPFNRSDV